MAKYVDGFVIVVPKKHLKLYKKMAELGKKVWMKHGALDYKECIGDDLTPNTMGMQQLPFKKLTKAKPSETVVFSYILYKSKAHRNAVNKKVMQDPLMNDPKYMDKQMPFDMKKFSWGGFAVLVDGK